MNNDYKFLQVALLRDDLSLFKKDANSVDVNASSDVTGMNILHYYISNSSKFNYSSEQLIEYLVGQRGVDVNMVDDEGLSPAYYSVVRVRKDILETLMKYGANFELPDDDGNTPLFKAVANFRGEKGYLDIILLLLNKGADINRKNKHGNSAKDYILRVSKGIDMDLNPKERDLRPFLKDYI